MGPRSERVPQRLMRIPALARLLITAAGEDFEIVALSLQDDWQVLEWMEPLNQPGGRDDALIARGAPNCLA